MPKNKLTETEKNRLLTLLRQKDRDKIPLILMPLWEPRRYKMITGGRGSAKTESVIRVTHRQSSNCRMRTIWGREIMESIKHSLWDAIRLMIPVLGYPGWVVHDDHIFNKKTKSEYIFKGFRDIKAAKQTKGFFDIDRLIVDEAESVLMDSWDIMDPTIRKDGSEVWAIWNRYQELDPVYEKFCLNANPATTIYIECNWRDNPWFPDVLRMQKDRDFDDDHVKALHIWENHPIAEIEMAVMDRIVVNDAMNRKSNPDGPQVIGVDIARYGHDKTKVYERRGNAGKKLLERFHKEPIKVAREIYDKMDNDYVMVNCDNGGLGGGGFIDMLRDLGAKNVNEINFGGKAKDDEQYGNTITEAYFEAKECLKTASIQRDSKLLQDLTGRLYKYDKKIKKILEEKEEFRKRYKRSPDDGDACVLCFYNPGKKLIIPGEARKKIALQVNERRIMRKRRFNY